MNGTGKRWKTKWKNSKSRLITKTRADTGPGGEMKLETLPKQSWHRTVENIRKVLSPAK